MNFETGYPSIGEIVHFHPDDYTRLAAIVVDVSPTQFWDEERTQPKRPLLNLIYFLSDGTAETILDCPPVDFQARENANMPVDADPKEFPEEVSLSGKWAFRDEVALLQKDEAEDLNGVHSNMNVGDQ